MNSICAIVSNPYVAAYATVAVVVSVADVALQWISARARRLDADSTSGNDEFGQ